MGTQERWSDWSAQPPTWRTRRTSSMPPSVRREVGGVSEPFDLNDLSRILEDLNPSGYVQTLFPDRPYDGQPHTYTGERGKTLVSGLTMRDIRDCLIAGCYAASGLPRDQYPRSIYQLHWEEMDPMAIWQNMLCEIERRMGIFPNVP